MSIKAQFPVIIEKISTLKDGSMKIVMETREFDPDNAAVLLSLRGREGWGLFSANELSEDDIPTENANADQDKTPSQRLRGVLFVRWSQLGKNGDFETYYRSAIEGFISMIKEKLEH